MSMKSRAILMALTMAAALGGNNHSSNSSFEPLSLPEEKKVLPGQFKGTIPKGCKITTVPIVIEWKGYKLTQYVDIISGSEKAKQKAIIKAEYEIRDYLKYRKSYGAEKQPFSEFHKVEELLSIAKSEE